MQLNLDISDERQVKSWEMEKGMIIGSQNEIYRLI